MGANLPYDISIPLLLNCMSLANPPKCLSVTVQYEAATRLCAQPGSKAWGASAALAQAAGQGKIIRKLPPQCFWPPPRVDSAIYFWQPQRTVPSVFGLWCRSIFAYRRKRLPRALRDNGMARDQQGLYQGKLALMPSADSKASLLMSCWRSIKAGDNRSLNDVANFACLGNVLSGHAGGR